LAVEPVIEHRESRSARWLHGRRIRIALLIAFIESLAVLFSDHGWWYVVGAAVVALALYFLGRRTSLPLVHEITWILAVSQLVSVLVPVLWVIVRTLAIIVLVLLGLFFLAMLLLDRGRK
jgi:hypothetical protein